MKNIDLNIKLNNQILNIPNINITDNIEFVKKQIFKLNGIQIKKQKLFLNNIELKNNTKIKELNINFIDMIICTVF
jgi:hypothetical protein